MRVLNDSWLHLPCLLLDKVQLDYRYCSYFGMGIQRMYSAKDASVLTLFLAPDQLVRVLVTFVF